MKEKLKRRHNWKSRQVNEVEEDDTETKKIKLDLPGVDAQRYDSSNALVLPSQKRKTKLKAAVQVQAVKKLSNKQRKKLVKIVATKKKKLDRKELLKALEKVQATQEESRLHLSTSEMQTKGLRKIIASKLEGTQLKSVKGSRRKINVVSKSDSSSEESEDPKSSDDDSSDDETVPEILENKNIIEPSGDKIQAQSECISVQEESKKSPDETNPTETTTSSVPVVSTPSKYRPVNRTDEIQENRLKLPILAEEQVVMEAINENPVVIICGETGSGKTTQVPQFLYEAGYTGDGRMIGITEPRRVAAVTMSQRVAYEMNLPSDIVSYQIRYEGNSTDKTEIKFMTDGVLMKEMQNDFLLTKYSVIVVDEAHERSVFTDILIALLSRIVPLRIKKGTPLKLVIMSATLRIEDFTENKYLFINQPPVVKVDVRQFTVSVHFNKVTKEDYVEEAYKKACKVHREQPKGGILIFVTGQREVNTLCYKLRQRFPMVNANDEEEDENEVENKKESSDEEIDLSQEKANKSQNTAQSNNTILNKVNLDDYSLATFEEGVDENEYDSEREDLLSDNEEMFQYGSKIPEAPMYVLPLYSFLPSHKQAIVFQPPPDGCRLCVVATNVAETSITIPNIKYVIDTGKVKMRLYDKVTGVSTFRIMFTSKASANQRAGRAGRTGAGHCYRLYSSAVFNDEFQQFSQPEICRRPIDDVVLLLKSMNIDKVLRFPFPTPVDADSIKASERRLKLLGALEIQKIGKKTVKDNSEESTKLTPLGQAIACFPVAPRYGKMLALSNQQGLLPYVVAITSSLTVNELLHESQSTVHTEDDKEVIKNNGRKWVEIRRMWAGERNTLKLGDVMVLLKAVGACEYVGCNKFDFEKYGVHYKSMIEVRKLRMQLTNAINLAIPSANISIDPKMPPPTDIQAKFLRQIMLAGLPDNVARRVLENEVTGDAEERRKWKKAYKSSYIEQPIFLHPSCVLFQDLPEYVVYQEIFESKKMYMKGVTAIEPEWLITFCPQQCAISNPMTEPEPRFDKQTGTVKCYATSTFGKCGWDLPATEIDYPEGLERLRWFARFLLNGEVFPKLAKFVDQLISPPATMIKSWARLQPKTEVLLNGLKMRNVYSKETLTKEWENDNKYLLKEYETWLPDSFHCELENLWPPL